MNFNWRIFGGVLVFSLIIGFLFGYSQYLEVHSNASGFQALTNWLKFLDGVITVVPLILFITFYWLGKRTNVVTNLKAVLISLLLGSVVGYFIGFGPFANLFITPGGSNMNILYSFVLQGALSIFWMSFCVGLAGLAVGYALNKNSQERQKEKSSTTIVTAKETV